MKVLHVTLSYKSAPALGGPDLTVYKLCTGLVHQGLEIDVVCTNLATKTTVIEPGTFEREVEGVRARYMDTRKLLSLGRNSFGVYYIHGFKKHLERVIRNYDLVHFHGFRDYETVVGSGVAARAGVPYLIHPRGTLPYQGHSILAKSIFDRFIGRRILRKASRVIALSQREVESFAALGVPEARVDVVNNGIESLDYVPDGKGEAFRAKHGIQEKYIILYFGRIHVIKGIDHLVRATAQLRREGFDVAAVVVGSDEGYAATLRAIAQQEAFGSLYILPAVPASGKREVLGAPNAMVYAAEVEDFGVSAFEGVMSGIPTVVAEETGCGEIFRRLDCGWQVPYGNVDRHVEVLRWILENQDAAKVRTTAARPVLEASLSWVGVASKVIETYRKVLG
jgi:glycosyltransferase involved in cell wall biosynthesis